MKNILLTIPVVTALLACATPVKQNKEIVGLEVNGELWRSVPSFNESAADDKHYVVRLEGDSTAVILFGDGKHGARLPTETNQIKVRYKVGGGYTGLPNQQGRVHLDGDTNCNKQE